MRLIDADALTSRLKTIFCKECKEIFGCVCCPVGDYVKEIDEMVDLFNRCMVDIRKAECFQNRY